MTDRRRGARAAAPLRALRHPHPRPGHRRAVRRAPALAAPRAPRPVRHQRPPARRGAHRGGRRGARPLEAGGEVHEPRGRDRLRRPDDAGAAALLPGDERPLAGAHDGVGRAAAPDLTAVRARRGAGPRRSCSRWCCRPGRCSRPSSRRGRRPACGRSRGEDGRAVSAAACANVGPLPGSSPDSTTSATSTAVTAASPTAGSAKRRRRPRRAARTRSASMRSRSPWGALTPDTASATSMRPRSASSSSGGWWGSYGAMPSI